MTEPRLQISPSLRAMLDFPRFDRRQLRVLILAAEYFFDQSWVRASESLGWRARTVRSAMVGALTREDIASLFTAVCEFKPDFVLASNYSGMDQHGIFARFFEDVRIPYVSWFTDTPRMILHERQVHASPYNIAATWERAYIPHFRSLGFEHVHFMPLATDPALFDAEPASEWARPLAFVGTSMIAPANEAWQKLQHMPELVAALQAAFNMGAVTREAFAAGTPDIIEPALLAQCGKSELRNTELLLVYEATRRQRAELALAMQPMGIEVRGDDNWRALVADCGGPIGYYDDLPPYYRSTAININNTSIQMRTAVNQRVFDCPAAGGFLITDAQPDLDELFDPDETVTYQSLEELRDKVRHYANHPEERRDITLRARRRILAHHTHACRLKKLADYLKSRFPI